MRITNHSIPCASFLRKYTVNQTRYFLISLWAAYASRTRPHKINQTPSKIKRSTWTNKIDGRLKYWESRWNGVSNLANSCGQYCQLSTLRRSKAGNVMTVAGEVPCMHYCVLLAGVIPLTARLWTKVELSGEKIHRTISVHTTRGGLLHFCFPRWVCNSSLRLTDQFQWEIISL